MSKAKAPKRAGRNFRTRFQPIALPLNFPAEGRSDEASGRARNMLRGSQRLWGIPFELAAEGAEANVLRLAEGEEVSVQVGAAATLSLPRTSSERGQVTAAC
ncbi:MAG: hypothetical protein QGI33_04055 [Candidatus Brocadiia bacterium]|jgi:hypothetical protein|nr:hypothetical protein [Candidatus Brocadiia bacterium]